jgi:mRNA interferase RelE/StbE
MNSAEYEIKFDARAAKDFRRLKQRVPAIIPQLIEVVDAFSFNPYSGKPLKGNKKGCYSCRSGDYRIIYEIFHAEKVIYVIRVGNRKDIYR